jgi:hypothetical protein
LFERNVNRQKKVRAKALVAQRKAFKYQAALNTFAFLLCATSAFAREFLV